LKGKIEQVNVPGAAHIRKLPEVNVGSGSWAQALAALEALGYKANEVRSTLQALAEEHGGQELPAEQLVRQALKRL
jgi:Holliday junction resolvasome RuvABC DNA-binding subunit